MACDPIWVAETRLMRQARGLPVGAAADEGDECRAQRSLQGRHLGPPDIGVLDVRALPEKELSPPL